MWTEVFSSVPHFLHMGSLHSSMICKCLLHVLCPVSRPVKTLVCVLLKDSSRAPIARSGPEINSRACLCVLQGPRHNARCFFSIQRFIFLLIFCLETPKTDNKMQLRKIIYCSLTALHVSNDIFAHHQEHLKCTYSFWFYSRVSLWAAVLAEQELSS